MNCWSSKRHYYNKWNMDMMFKSPKYLRTLTIDYRDYAESNVWFQFEPSKFSIEIFLARLCKNISRSRQQLTITKLRKQTDYAPAYTRILLKNIMLKTYHDNLAAGFARFCHLWHFLLPKSKAITERMKNNILKNQWHNKH